METPVTLYLPSLFDLGPLVPTLAVVGTAVLILLLDLFGGEAQRKNLAGLSVFGLFLSLALTAFLGGSVGVDPRRATFAFHDCLRFDRMTVLAHEAILLTTGIIVLVSPRCLRGKLIPQGEYYSLILFAAASMMALACSNELLTLFLNLETLSITLYVLAGIERDNLRSTEAAFKYFLMGSYSAAFLLFGLTMVYGATGQTGFNAIGALLASGAVEHKLYLEAGFALMMVGFAFKLTLFPFHMYAPDLYAGAPTPVAGLIATGSKAAGLAALFNFLRLAASWKGLPDGFYYGFVAVAAMSILVGNVGALTQPNIKRLLAYSGVAHSGYAMIPLIAWLHLSRSGDFERTLITLQVERAISFYFLAYGLMTALAFAVAATLGSQGESNIDRYAGLARRSPLMAAALALALISLTGVPPTVGFLGKFYLFSAAVNAKLYGLAAFGVLASVASAYYYLRVIVKMYMEEPPEAKPETAPVEVMNVIALAGAAVGVFLFAVFPMIYLFD